MSLPEFNRRSLRRRLALMLAAALGLTLALGFFGLHHVVRRQIYDDVQERLDEHWQAITEHAAQRPGEESAIDEMLEFRSNSHEDFFEIRDGHGRLLGRSASSAGRDLEPPPDGPAAGLVHYALRLPDGHAGIATWGEYELPVGDPRGRLVTIVAREFEQMEALESHIHTAMLAVALATLAAAIVATTFAIRRGLEPVDRLAHSAESIDPDGPRRPLEIGELPAELSPLGTRLGSLLDRLFDARDRERRFNRSVAHELRTPLAELRMIADVGVRSQSPGEMRAALVEVGTAAGELQHIVDALLTLARCESGQEPLDAEPVELVAELAAELAKIDATARQRSLAIEAAMPRERWVMANAPLLRRLLSNLVGNAVVHAPAGSAIWVSLQAHGPLQLGNPAPHLEADDIAHLGERFYSVDSGSGQIHAGLGLSLAGAIARVLDLELGFRLDASGRLTVSVGGFHPLPGSIGAGAAPS